MKSKLLLIITAILLTVFPIVSFGQAPTLGATSHFALFTAGGAFTSNGATVVTGDIASYTYIPVINAPGSIIGTIYGVGTASDPAFADVSIAFSNFGANGTVLGTPLETFNTTGFINPGTYHTTGAAAMNGNFTLDALGDPNAIFVININGTLTVGAGFNILLANNAQYCNVYWQIKGDFILGAGSVFRGTIISNGAITLNAGSNLYGRALTTAGAISLAANVVTIPTGCGLLSADFTGTPLVICEGSIVTFTNTSTGTSGATTYSWNFGAGATPATANTIGPIAVTYSTSGLKTVTLTITDGTSDTKTKTDYITVNSLPAAPTVDLITQPTCAVATGSVDLSGLPAGTWTINPGAISGSTVTTTLSGLATGTHNYTVTNAAGCISAASANIVIDAQPSTLVVANQTATISSGSTFTVSPAGVPVGTTYAWTVPAYTNSVTGGVALSAQANISGTLTIPAGTGTAIYTVTPTSGSCVGVDFTVTVTVNSSVPVTIGTQPVDNSACVISGNSSFTVVPAGTAPFTYQWQYNNGGVWANVVNGTPSGAIYSNETTATLGVSGISTGGSYQYRSYVTNNGGVDNATSNVVTLTVNTVPSAPVFTTTQPDCSVATGSAVFSGLPAGAWTLTRTPGAVVTTGSGANYTISGLATGTYTYTLTDGTTLCTSPTSADVVINAQPVTLSVVDQAVSIASGIAFSDIPAGVPVGTTYTWGVPVYTNGVTGGSAQSNQTTIGETLFIPTGTGTATYTVTPTSGLCVGTPFTAIVTVTSSCVPVTIGTQPANTILCAPAGNASIIVVAAGTAPFTYQWQYNSGGIWAAVVDGTPSGAVYSNQTTSTLGISGITVNGSYQYRSYVTNCTGSSNATSNAVNLTVNTSPAAPIVGTITQTDCFVATGSVILSGLPAAGTWTLTRTPGGTISTGTGTTATITGVPVGTNTYTVTDGITLCTSVASAVVVINPQPIPAAPTVTLTQPDCNIATGTILITAPTGAGMTYSIDGTNYTNTSGIFANVPMGTYTVTAKNADGCISKK